MATVDWANATAIELAALWEAKGHGLTPAVLKQTRVPLDALQVAPKVFQPRNPDEVPWAKEQHIGNLVASIKQRGLLDPIMVFPIDGQRIVVDGHCRLEAYKQAKWTRDVAVKHLKGTFTDALMRSVEANAKDTLSLTKAEKTEGAWRLVVYDEGPDRLSLRDIADGTGVGKSTVKRMKDILQGIPKGSANDPRGDSWANLKRGQRRERPYDERWEDKLRHDWAKRLRRVFNEKPEKMPHVFIGAVEDAYPGRSFSAFISRIARDHADAIRERIQEFANHDF